QGVGIQSTGHVVAVGYNESNYDTAAVVRFTADGVPDASFGTAGVVTLDGGLDWNAASEVAIDSSDRIVVAGRADAHMAIARLTSTGDHDATFGGAGARALVTVDHTGIA